MYESASNSVFLQHGSLSRWFWGWRLYEDSCTSCLDTKKYHCLRCKFPPCNKRSLPEKNTKFQVGKLKSLLRIVCLARKKTSEEKILSQFVFHFPCFLHERTCFILSPRVLIIYAWIITVNVFAHSISFSQSASCLPWIVQQVKRWFYLEKPLPNKTVFWFRWCSSSVRLN